MSKDDITSDLGPKDLSKLFKICSEKETDDKPVNSNQKRKELLLDRLADTIQLENITNTALSAEMKHLCEISGISTGTTIRDLIVTPETDIRFIRKLKDNYKSSFKISKSKAEQDAATAIYYAAIGHALIFHGKRITSFSYKELSEAFSKFSRIKWISHDLREIYKKAQEYCGNKADTSDKEFK